MKKIYKIIFIIIFILIWLWFYFHFEHKNFIKQTTIFGNNPQDTYLNNFNEIQSICFTLLYHKENQKDLYYNNFKNKFPWLDWDYLNINWTFKHIDKKFLCKFKWDENKYVYDITHIENLEKINSESQSYFKNYNEELLKMCKNTAVSQYNLKNGFNTTPQDIKMNKYELLNWNIWDFPSYQGVNLYLVWNIWDIQDRFICNYRWEWNTYRLLSVDL